MAPNPLQRQAHEADERDQRPGGLDDRRREVERAGQREKDQAGAGEVDGQRWRAFRVEAPDGRRRVAGQDRRHADEARSVEDGHRTPLTWPAVPFESSETSARLTTINS